MNKNNWLVNAGLLCCFYSLDWCLGSKIGAYAQQRCHYGKYLLTPQLHHIRRLSVLKMHEVGKNLLLASLD